ncbi:MAG: hypothetical protein KAI70_06710 [Candidatus Omnitrophica bacterium]|nr:hypothetical protein [Candidatus Omnitrophota bacterium]
MREKVLVLFFCLMLSLLVVKKVEGFGPTRLSPSSSGPNSSIDIVTPNKKAELESEKTRAKEVEEIKEVKKLKEEKGNNDLFFIMIAGIVAGGLFLKFSKKKKNKKTK